MQQVLTCLSRYRSSIGVLLLHKGYGEVAMITSIRRFIRYKYRSSQQVLSPARMRGLCVAFCLSFCIGSVSAEYDSTPFTAQTVAKVKSVNKSRSLKRTLNENEYRADFERKHRSDTEIQALKRELRAALRVYDTAEKR